jgi:hypothetical protein
MSRSLRVRGDALEWRRVEGEIVALDLRRSEYLAINASGAVLWPALLEGATREQLVERLRDKWGLSSQAAERDVDAFLAQLEERDLLERAP